MNESMDRLLADWLNEGPESGPRDGLERALAATRRVGQRPGWTLFERWLPMQLTMTRTPQRPIVAFVVLALIVAFVATTMFIGSRQRDLPAPLFRNGAIVYEEGGDLFIADQLGGTPRTLVSGPEADSDPAFSPQGDRIAFVREAGPAVMTVRTDGTEVRELARIPSVLGLQLEWAPDGGAILVSSDGTFGTSGNGTFLIQTDGSGSRIIGAGVDGGSGRAAWRPDGRQIAFLDAEGAGVVTVIADADGTNVRRLPIDGMKTRSGLAWSPDGTRLAVGESFESTITVVDIDADGDMTASRELPFHPDMSAEPGPSWSPDGSRLAVMLMSGRVGIVASDGSSYRTVGPAVADLGSADFVWSPDGRTLVRTGHILQEDPQTHVHSWTKKAWSVDVATGEQTEAQTPVDSWQRLAP